MTPPRPPPTIPRGHLPSGPAGHAPASYTPGDGANRRGFELSSNGTPTGPPSLPSRVRRAAGPSWRHRTDLALALVLLPVVAVGLRRRGYRWTADRLAAGRTDLAPPDRGGPDDQLAMALDVAFVVRQAGRLAPDATCLRQALVVHHLLARRGVPSRIRIGVRPGPASGLAFHAWVEVDGRPVSEPPDAVAGFVALNDGAPPPGLA